MKLFRRDSTIPALALVAGLGLATDAQALNLLYSETHDYGTGQFDPGGNDTLGSDFVTVSDASTGRFADSFTFGTGLGTIDRIDVILGFANVSDTVSVFGKDFSTKDWRARIIGSDSTGSPTESSDDFFKTITGLPSPQTLSISSATDTGSIDAFSHSVGTGILGLWFSEKTLFHDQFNLDYATVEVYGTTAPIPVPAALPLLLTVFGGLGLAARARRKAA